MQHIYSLLSNRRFRRGCAKWCSIIVMINALIVLLTSLLVITGWVFNLPTLKSFIQGFVTMKFSTAFSFFLSALILWLLNTKKRRFAKLKKIALPIFSTIIFIYMGIFLTSSYINVITGFEDIFFIENNAIFTTVPGRPSLGTALNFLLIAVTGMLGAYKFPYKKRPVKWMSLVISSIGALALIGYAVEVPLLYYNVENFSSAMAIHTAVLFVLLGVGLFIFSHHE